MNKNRITVSINVETQPIDFFRSPWGDTMLIGRIEAIKLVRLVFGFRLAKAKEMVDKVSHFHEGPLTMDKLRDVMAESVAESVGPTKEECPW